eukprot:SAG11_NODE_5834_length_1453_cov_1.042097_1_plen_81_part_01
MVPISDTCWHEFDGDVAAQLQSTQVSSSRIRGIGRRGRWKAEHDGLAHANDAHQHRGCANHHHRAHSGTQKARSGATVATF